MIMFLPKLLINVFFYFEICQFPILNGDVPRSTSYGVYGVYISQPVTLLDALANHLIC